MYLTSKLKPFDSIITLDCGGTCRGGCWGCEAGCLGCQDGCQGGSKVQAS